MLAQSKGFTLVDDRDGYLRAVEAIASGTGPAAVDAERASGYRYSQRAYLIQVHRRGSGTFLFDPPTIEDFSELDAALSDTEWVFHAASQDLDCLREVGMDPHRIFDTELGARLAGLPRVGLGTIVDELLGFRLAKEHSAVDWSTRPLSDSWLTYAALDVEVLPDLRDAVASILIDQDKQDIARQEFDSVLTRSPRPSARGEGWRRLSGVHSVRGGRNLSVAKALWEARDEYAREIDVAPGRLIPDASIVAAAKRLPESKRALAGIKEFTGRASRSQIDRWWVAIESGLAETTPPTLRVAGLDTIPPPKAWADRNPEADRRYRHTRPLVAARAEELGLPVENLLLPDTLRRIAWNPPHPLTVETIRATLEEHEARPWQIDETVQIIVSGFVEADQMPETPSDSAS